MRFFGSDGEIIRKITVDLTSATSPDDGETRVYWALDLCLDKLDELPLASKKEKADALERYLINLLSSNLAKPDIFELWDDIQQLEALKDHINTILEQSYRVYKHHRDKQN